MIVDANSQVCPGPDHGEDWPAEVLDTIRSLGLGEAGLAAVLSGSLHRVMRL